MLPVFEFLPFFFSLVHLPGVAALLVPEFGLVVVWCLSGADEVLCLTPFYGRIINNRDFIFVL
jgi:hypothetical protein